MLVLSITANRLINPEKNCPALHFQITEKKIHTTQNVSFVQMLNAFSCPWARHQAPVTRCGAPVAASLWLHSESSEWNIVFRRWMVNVLLLSHPFRWSGGSLWTGPPQWLPFKHCCRIFSTKNLNKVASTWSLKVLFWLNRIKHCVVPLTYVSSLDVECTAER